MHHPPLWTIPNLLLTLFLKILVLQFALFYAFSLHKTNSINIPLTVSLTPTLSLAFHFFESVLLYAEDTPDLQLMMTHNTIAYNVF